MVLSLFFFYVVVVAVVVVGGGVVVDSTVAGFFLYFCVHVGNRDLLANAIVSAPVGVFDDLFNVTEFSAGKSLGLTEGAVEACARALVQEAPLAYTGLCMWSYEAPGETAFLVITAAFSAFLGLLLFAVLHRNNTDVKRSDMLSIAFFSMKTFDLYTDFGVYKFQTQRPDWENVFYSEFAPWQGEFVKYALLSTAIIGTLLFIPEIFLLAAKVDLSADLKWPKPTRKWSIVIVTLSLLLESVPQLACAGYIGIRYLYFNGQRIYDPNVRCTAGICDSWPLVTLPIVAASFSLISIISDATFLFKLCCGKRCCCCCACCDVSAIFSEDAETLPTTRYQPKTGSPPAAANSAKTVTPSLSAVELLQHQSLSKRNLQLSPGGQKAAALDSGQAASTIQETSMIIAGPQRSSSEAEILDQPHPANAGNRALPAYPSLVLSNASAMTGTSLADGEILNSTAPPPAAESRDGNAFDNGVVTTYQLATASRNVQTAKPRHLPQLDLNQMSSVIINPALSAKTPPSAFGIEGNALGTPKQIAGKQTATYFFASASGPPRQKSGPLRQNSDV